MKHEPAPVLDTLLAERPFVQRVTRQLMARDANAADDLEQEVWTAALRNPPRQPSSLRGWLRRVARGQLVERLRGQGRATLAEERAARTERIESAEDSVMRRDSCEHLARALRALEEPYRSVVVLRFVEDLPPREVARRLDRPVETVRTQTRRALAILRSRLEREHGSRRASALFGLLLVEPPAPRIGVAAAAGSVGAALIGATAWLAWPLVAGAPSAVEAASAEVAAPVPEDTSPVAAREPRANAREALAASSAGTERASSAVLAPAADPPARRVELVVLDAFGAPLAGARVESHVAGIARSRGATDAAGLLEVPVASADLLGQDGSWILPEDGVELAVSAPGFVTRSVVVLLPEAGSVPVHLALQGPACDLEGRVLDGQGRGLPGARVAIAPKAGVGTRQALEGTPRAIAVIRPRSTVSDASGKFRLAGLAAEDVYVMAWAPGHAVAWEEATLGQIPGELVILELARAQPIRGRVELADGRPVEGARVGATHHQDGPAGAGAATPIPLPPEWRRGRTDAGGNFALPRPRRGPLRLDALWVDPSAEEWRDDTRLELVEDTPVTWTARLEPRTTGLVVDVVDGAGAPVPGLYVAFRSRGVNPERQSAVTDASGRVRFSGTDGFEHALDVYPSRAAGAFPWSSLAQVAAGEGQRVRVLLADYPDGTAAVRGALPGLAAGANARVVVRHRASGTVHAWPADPLTGAFEIDRLPPGLYAFDVETDAGPVGTLGERELGAREELMLGDFRPVGR